MYADIRSAQRHLQELVAQSLWRLRMQAALDAAVIVATIAAWLLVPLVLLQRVLSLDALGLNVWVAWVALLALGFPYILWRMFSTHIHEQFAAVMADERLGLHARLCTALTLDPEAAPEFSEAFYAEAAERLARLNPAQAFPIRTPRMARLLPLPALLAAGIWFLVPQQDRAGFVAMAQEKRRAEEALERVPQNLKEQLQDLKQDQTDNPLQDSAEYKVNQLIKKAEAIAKEMEQGQRDPNEAVVALADLKREIGEEKEKLADKGKDFAERLKQLSQKELNLEDGDMTRAVSEALKEGDTDKAAAEMRKLARKIKNEILNDKNKSDEEKAAALKQLKTEIERLAGALEQDKELAEDLMEAARKSMDASEFEKLTDEIKEQLKNQGGKTATQLAEELEAEMNEAADEMQEMAEQDEEALSPEDEEAKEDLESLEASVDEAMEGLVEQKPGGG